MTPSRLRLALAIVILAALQLWALFLMLWSEPDLIGKAAFLLAWGMLNAFWIMLLRRPAASAGLAVMMVMVLIALSMFKHFVLMMTVSFTDILIVDTDTISFLLDTFTDLEWYATLALLIAVPLLAAVFWLDPLRVRWRTALAGLIVCFAPLAGLSFAIPLDRGDAFYGDRFLSKFARSGVIAAFDLATRGFLESDPRATERLPTMEAENCQPPAKLPHIVLVFDEFELRCHAYAGNQGQTELPAALSLVRWQGAQIAGRGSRWSELAHRIQRADRAVGTVLRAVCRIRYADFRRTCRARLGSCAAPLRLSHLQHVSFSRRFSRGAPLSNRRRDRAFFRRRDLGGFQKTDSHYYDFALQTLTWERTGGPMFLLVYTAANHFPWNGRYRPDLLSDWRNLGNRSDVDEYLRRQAMSAQDYPQFIARLRVQFPGESFLVVRFGDHQPLFAKYFVDPTLGEAEVAKRIQANDPRYFTTYYAIDTHNFTPADLSSALDTLDAPYLPLMLLEAAGVPLDPSFEEQKKILQRCNGLFYGCKEGAEARRFNRLLIDAGLINGL